MKCGECDAAKKMGGLTEIRSWMKEWWIQARIAWGLIDAEELKKCGKTGTRALVHVMTRHYLAGVRVESMRLAGEAGLNSLTASALAHAALHEASWKVRAAAISILGRKGNSAAEVIGLLEITENLRKEEAGVLLRKGIPKGEDILLQRIAERSLVEAAGRLPFEDHITIITAEKKEWRIWALKKFSGISMSGEEIKLLKGLEMILKKSKGDSREELGELRRIISTWETDRIVMGKVRGPQKTGQPKQPRKDGNGKKIKR